MNRAILVLALSLVACGGAEIEEIEAPTAEAAQGITVTEQPSPDAGNPQVEAAWRWCPQADGSLEARLYHQGC